MIKQSIVNRMFETVPRQDSFFKHTSMKFLFLISNASILLSLLPKIYNSKIGIGNCSVVYNSHSICFLKLDIPRKAEYWILPKVNEIIKYFIESKNKKILFLNHYHSNTENGNSENKIIRIEVIYSAA